MPTIPRRRTDEPPVAPVVMARGYARHYLKNRVVFWGVAALVFGALIALSVFSGVAVTPADIPAAAVGAALSIFRGGPALWDLLGQPVAIEGKVAEKSASLFWNRLTMLEDKHHLRLERGDDHRPIAYGTGVDLAEGWFLAGRGYYEILARGSRIRGTAYRRTRVIDSLVKV